MSIEAGVGEVLLDGVVRTRVYRESRSSRL
jgi:hypothetical protein